jgi:hypothetical protein
MFDPTAGSGARRFKDNAREIRDVSSRSKENALELDELEARVDRLYLVNQALWALLKQKTGLTDQELQKEIEKLDLVETKPASTSTALVCKDCNRTVSRRHKICIYCGGPDLVEPPGASPIG